MITYIYHCKNCKQTFEIKQKISDEPLTTCIKCDTVGALEKVIVSSGGFRIRGKGVYKNTSKMD